MVRWLAYRDIQFHIAQTARAEFDLVVSNVATDFRNGVRLARIVEYLTATTLKDVWWLHVHACARTHSLHESEHSVIYTTNMQMPKTHPRQSRISTDTVDATCF